MTKTDLIELLSKEHRNLFPTKEAAKAAVNAVLNSIMVLLEKGESVSLHGFGNFVLRHRPAREGRNPRTGERIRIAGSSTVSFKPALYLRGLLDSPQSSSITTSYEDAPSFDDEE